MTLKSTHRRTARLLCRLACCVLAALLGCGTTKSQTATEQLLMSDAVDRSIAQIDFRVLAGKKVYFDTQYINEVKGGGFVNADYIISSLRQQMAAANCRLQDVRDEADYVVEARVGALGTDGHEIIYGIPASNALNSAAEVMPNAPPIPPLPEIALAKRNNKVGAAKIAVFAYDLKTRRPVWQSGIARANSTANDAYLFGAGPFQRGTIYGRTQFAGSELHLPLIERDDGDQAAPPVAYDSEIRFPRIEFPPPPTAMPASFEVDESAGGPKVLSPAEQPADAPVESPAAANPPA